MLNLVTIPYIIAMKKGSPIQDPRRLIDYIRSNPGALTYGSPGIGSAPYLGMEAFARGIRGNVTHIPYSGIATAMQALLGGHIDAVIGAPSTVMPQVDAGAVIGIAVTSKERFPMAPDLPTLTEVGVDVDVSTHFAFYAPKGTPPSIVRRLSAALSDAAQDAAFRRTMELTRTQIDVLQQQVLARVLEEEQARFEPVIKSIRN